MFWKRKDLKKAAFEFIKSNNPLIYEIIGENTVIITEILDAKFYDPSLEKILDIVSGFDKWTNDYFSNSQQLISMEEAIHLNRQSKDKNSPQNANSKKELDFTFLSLPYIQKNTARIFTAKTSNLQNGIRCIHLLKTKSGWEISHEETIEIESPYGLLISNNGYKKDP